MNTITTQYKPGDFVNLVDYEGIFHIYGTLARGEFLVRLAGEETGPGIIIPSESQIEYRCVYLKYHDPTRSLLIFLGNVNDRIQIEFTGIDRIKVVTIHWHMSNPTSEQYALLRDGLAISQTLL